MAILGRWTGGAQTQGNLPESWTAPNGLFPTEARNDSSTYTWTSSTSTITLPSSGLADGYLFIGRYEYQDTSNGRFNPQGKIVQASGTGNFVGPPAGGFNRNNNNNQSFVSCWAVVDSPSAAATFQFQWKADTDDATGGTAASSFDVIPIFYSDIGMYSSTSALLYGGTTPTTVTLDTTVLEGTNITRSGNVVTVTGNNKRYFILSGQFYEGRGGRTQRWFGHSYDSTQDRAAQAYTYYRNTSNDESGNHILDLISTSTASRTVEMTCYRGDGVLAGEGGADIDGSTPSVGDHGLVVIELNDTAEVFRGKDSINSTDLDAGVGTPVVLAPVRAFGGGLDFADSASFVPSFGGTYVTISQDMDVLAGANIGAASRTVTSGTRYEGKGNLTVNGTEDDDVFHGNYGRGNQGGADCFGYSANPVGFVAVSNTDQLGVSHQQTGDGGDFTTQPNWVGFWGINIDTMGSLPPAGDISGSTDGSATVTGTLVGDGELVGDTDGVATSSGTLQGLASIIGDASGLATVSGTLTGKSFIDGEAGGAASTLGTLVGDGELIGQTNGQATSTGTISSVGSSPIDGETNGSTNVSGTLQGKGVLAGETDGVTTILGTLVGDGQLVGQTDGGSTTSGSLQADADISGQTNGEAAVSGTLAANGGLEGQSGGQSSTQGVLEGLGELEGQINGLATTSGTLSLTGSNFIQGQSDGQAAVDGVLFGKGELQGVVGGIASTEGQLLSTGELQGSTISSSTTSGTLVGKTSIVGQTNGQSVTSGVLQGIGEIEGVTNGSSVVTGDLSALAAGSLRGQVSGSSSATGVLIGSGQLVGESLGSSTTTGKINIPAPPAPGPTRRPPKRKKKKGSLGGIWMPTMEGRDVEIIFKDDTGQILEEDEEVLTIIKLFLDGVT